MELYKVNVSEPAEYDLRGIASYISRNLCEPEVAIKMTHTLERAIINLEHTPHKYALLSENSLAAEGLRKFMVKNYLVFFTIDEVSKIVNVERVLYARRDWVRILSSSHPSPPDTPPTTPEQS